MIKRSKLRFYSLILSVLLLFSGITGCTKQAAESKTKGNTELSSNDNALKAANSAVSNNLELLDTKKEAADAESNYEYAKEILFWQPDQKLEVTSKSKLDSLKVDDKIPAVQFFLDDKFTIEIETKYDYEALADNNQKYTIYPNVNGLDAVGNLYHYEDTETKDSKQNIKEAIRLRGGSVGWSSGDIIYMLQNVNFETGEKLSKPIVTTIVMDREERQALTPEYYVNDNGEFYAQWDPVEGADAYAIVSYYKMPDMDRLDEMIKENNEKAKHHEKDAAPDDPLVINELEKVKEGKDDGTSNIFYMEDSKASIVDIVTDTKYSINEADFYADYIKKQAEAGYVTSSPNYIQTALLPESTRYLAVVALKKGTGTDGSEAAQDNANEDGTFSELLKELDEEVKEPGYFAIEESPLYDFNALAQRVPSYVKKYESKYPSTSKFTVDKAGDITSFIYVAMTDGSIRKHNLEYMDEYVVEPRDIDEDDNKETMQEVLSVKVKVKNTPFYFKYNIKEFDKANPDNDIEIIKNTFAETVKFKADIEEYPSKAPIVKIDKVNKTISFISDGEKKFYNSSLNGKDSSASNKPLSTLAISSVESDGGLSAYSDSERSECLPETVIASTKMSEEIAWALMTGQREFVLNYNTSSSEIAAAIQEACWQNQYILELDNPEGNIERQNDGSYLVEMDYFISDINQRKEMQKAMKAKATSILKSLEGKYSNSLDFLYQVNKYICDNVEYDWDTIADGDIKESTTRTAYGPLVEGKAICSGYSRAFQLLMTMSNFNCFVDGGVTPGGWHAWNIVKTKDGYYMVDCTWNDDSEVSNLYLMVPEEIYDKNHQSKRICITEDTTLERINYAYYGGNYDYLSNIGKAVTLNDLDNALYAYGSYSYCPNWLRVYDFHGDVKTYLTSAANALYDESGISVYYTAEWKDSEPNIIYFTSPQLDVTEKNYGEKIE
jgi:putative uncharacterized protein (fragment)